MKQCILHVGMSKTGTTSIQESLYYDLSDPAFRYIDLGQVNHVAAMTTLFSDTPENSYVHRRMGRSAQQVAQYRVQLLYELDKHLAATDVGVQSILSAEYCWGMRWMEYERVRKFMADRGYIVRIIAYVRPWKPWLESSFQQRLQAGLSSFQVSPASHSKIDYRERIETLETVFGSEHVQVFKYEPSTFLEGCVVRHFCQQVGIHFDAGRIRRANGSLTLPAVQLLYAYRKFGPGYGTGTVAGAENAWLVRRLREVQGPALRFHSSAVEPVLSKVLPQVPWLEQRLGLPFTEDLTRYDQGACIRTEADLFDFDAAALGWLADATQSGLARPSAGEDAARAVAAQMHKLRQLRPGVPVHVKVRRLMRRVSQRLRRWGDWSRG
jgi:hypothetical protein